MGILTLNSVLCKWLCIPVSHLCWQEETHLKRKLLGNGVGEAGRTNPNLAVFQNKKMKPATHTQEGENMNMMKPLCKQLKKGFGNTNFNQSALIKTLR